jgi:adenylate cyclase
MVLLFEQFVWRMIAAGLPLDRASVHVGTLHPQLIGFAWNWLINDGYCDEIKVTEATNTTDSYTKSALYRVLEFGEAVQRKTRDPAAQAEFPIMKEFAEQGLTEYIAMPMSGAGTYHNAMTVATKRDGGFSEDELVTIRRMLDLFALHVERHIALRIADNTLNAYLGETAASKVLHGTIKRGSGEPIRAIIWVSDLRGFTDLSGRLGDANMIALLNAYFECLAGAVLRHGGEVLKFMGDGLLAVFPFEGDGAKAAARSAVSAAQSALQALDKLNTTAPAPLDTFDGWKPLRTGIALHEGDVFFGNIGAPDRLDFTVIGSAVNEASRVEALQKTLGRSLLITATAARHLDVKLDDLGEHVLRGVEGKIRIFSPAAS